MYRFKKKENDKNKQTLYNTIDMIREVKVRQLFQIF
jgi:hypothetical protein